MKSINEALDTLDEIKESLFTRCKNSSLKDNPIELNAVLRAYEEMFDKIFLELKEYDKHSDLVWNLRRSVSVVIDQERCDTLIKLYSIFKKCIFLDKNNKLTIRDTPSQEELKLLLDNRFNEDK